VCLSYLIILRAAEEKVDVKKCQSEEEEEKFAKKIDFVCRKRRKETTERKER
jgi:hypothetical protein